MTASFFQFPMKLFSLLAIVAFIVLSIVMLVATDTSHAVLRHGDEAYLGRECIGQGTVFLNPTTNRKGNVCLTSAGFYGVWISEDGKEVTSFVKNKMKRFEQIKKYMENAGYSIVH